MVRWHLKTWITDLKGTRKFSFFQKKKKRHKMRVYRQTEYQYKQDMGF